MKHIGKTNVNQLAIYWSIHIDPQFLTWHYRIIVTKLNLGDRYGSCVIWRWLFFGVQKFSFKRSMEFWLLSLGMRAA